MGARKPRPHEFSYYSSGQWFTPQVYVVGWREHGIVKVGSTDSGVRRYGRFLSRGAELLHLQTYPIFESIKAETDIQGRLCDHWGMAFSAKTESLEILGPQGNGWMECFSVAARDWDDMLGLIRGGDEHSVVQS